MPEKWYDELGDDAFLTEADKKYKRAIEKIKDAVISGTGLDEACDLAGIEDPGLKAELKEDALKVLIADMHFMQKMPVDKVAEALKIPVERVNSAKEKMLEEVKDASIKAFYKSLR